METIERLEKAVRRLIEEEKRLAAENEILAEKAWSSGNELDEARETIRALHGDIERFRDAERRLKEFEKKKNDIREYLRSIIEKIDRHVESDDVVDTYANV